MVSKKNNWETKVNRLRNNELLRRAGVKKNQMGNKRRKTVKILEPALEKRNTKERSFWDG